MKPVRKTNTNSAPADPRDAARREDIAALFSRIERSFAARPVGELTDRALTRDEKGVLDDLRFLIGRSRDPGSFVALLRTVTEMMAAESLAERSPEGEED